MTRTLVERRASDLRLLGAAGYALALQIGHPTVAAGVRDHSNFTVDPWGRFFGTVDFVNLLVYGSPEQTAAATRNLRAMHARIRGTDAHGQKYSALEPHAYAWVHATLAEALVRGHRIFGSPFTRDEKEQFWREWLELGHLLGVRDGDLPPTWSELQVYVQHTIEHVLEYNELVDVVQNTASHATGGSPLRWLPPRAWAMAGVPLGRYVAFLGRGTMGRELRAKYRIAWGPRQQRTFAAIAAAHRASSPVLPPVLRHVGPTILRARRREVLAGPFAA
ncbi:MAG: hypothetical protein QOK28_2485 [Actinomycetota bacterium]|jgi:uncharacterized protein (DUF2236 family)